MKTNEKIILGSMVVANIAIAIAMFKSNFKKKTLCSSFVIECTFEDRVYDLNVTKVTGEKDAIFDTFITPVKEDGNSSITVADLQVLTTLGEDLCVGLNIKSSFNDVKALIITTMRRLKRRGKFKIKGK